MLALALAAACLGGVAPSRAAAVPMPLPLDSLAREDRPRVRMLAAEIGALGQLRREAEYAANAFRRYMGPYPPTIGIAALGTLADPERVSDERLRFAGYPHVLRDWPRPPGGRPAALAADATAWIEQPSERMSRWYLAAFESEQGRGAPPEGRARFVPDWFEAALAGLATHPSEQNQRVAWMHARMDRRIPIERFLAMSRPPDPPVSAGRSRSGAGGARPRGSVKEASGPAGAGAGASAASSAGPGAEAPTRRLYDAQALSFARFLSHKEGERFLGHFLEKVLLGEPQRSAFNIAKFLLPHPEVLEKEWLAWVKEGAPQTGPVRATPEESP